MNLDRFVSTHKVLATLVGAVAVAVFWVVTTFATIGYVDKNVKEIREEKVEMLMDIKDRLHRIENLIIKKQSKED